MDAVGPVRSRVSPLDDGGAAKRWPRHAILALAYSRIGALPIALFLCLAGAATASLSMNLYAVAQMFAGPRAPGTWVGFQNAFGNLSGIFGPIVTGIIVDRAGYASAFYLTAAVAAVRSLGGHGACHASSRSSWIDPANRPGNGTHFP